VISAVIVVDPRDPGHQPALRDVGDVGLLDDQLAVLPGIGWLALSRACAVSCTVVPMRSSCGLNGVSTTEDTCGLTTTTASLERRPSTVTLMRAVPEPVPVTTPLALTDATIELLDCHTT
jgi:hypothetical protein